MVTRTKSHRWLDDDADGFRVVGTGGPWRSDDDAANPDWRQSRLAAVRPPFVRHIHRADGFEALAELLDESVPRDITYGGRAEEHAQSAAVLVLMDGEGTEVVQAGVNEIEQPEHVLVLPDGQVEGGVISQRCP